MAETRAFGLAFDIQRSPLTRSGFEPAPFDLGGGKDLFADVRLDGFAALLRLGFADSLTIVGGDEGRYKGEMPVVNRAEAIASMLVHDRGIPPELVNGIPSRSNTGGNVAIIREMIAQTGGDGCVVSNLYHVPRAALDMRAAGLTLPLYAAEAFILMESPDRKSELIERLGGSALAERYAEEAQGIAHKLLGTYKPRTDAPAIPFAPRSPARA